MDKTKVRNILYVGGPFHGVLERKEITSHIICISQFNDFSIDTRNAPYWLAENHTYTKLMEGDNFDVWQHQSLISPQTEANALDSLITELMKRRDDLGYKYGI